MATTDASRVAYATTSVSKSSPPAVSCAQPSRSDARERRRLSERRSRDKRKDHFSAMRLQIQALEFVVTNVPFALLDEPFIAEDDRIADSTDAAESDRVNMARVMRVFLRKSMALSEEAKTLRRANQEIAYLLKEYDLSATALRQLTKGMQVDEWTLQKERWSEITHDAFRPWTVESCWEVVKDSMRHINKFTFADSDSESTGLSFMGWRDRRRLDLNTATVHFSFTKTYHHTDAEMMARAYWDVHLDGERYARCMIAPNVKWYYEVMQHVSPDMCIVRCVEQYPAVPFKVHQILLVFRLRTRGGFVHGVRSIPCPDVQLQTDDEDAYWTTNFHWTKWDITQRNAQGECTEVLSSVNGSLASGSVDYVNRWMGEAILTLVRAESILLGRSFLKWN